MTDRPDTADAIDPVYPNPRDPAEALDRRHFLALTGAAAALAGAGCSPRPAPHGEFVPYVRPPEGVTPGKPLTFTTAMALGGSAIGLVVTSREGHPIKVDGNPDHPGSRGASDLFSQASILDLYDPDRSRQVLRRGAPRSWDDALAALRTGLEQQRPKQGAGLRVLTGALTSPTLAATLGELFRQFPQAKWCRHEPCEGNARAGSIQVFGEPVYTILDFAKADVVVSLDADFLACSPGTVAYQRQFADRRRVLRNGSESADHMSRLYAIETMVTVTGANADHRLAVRPSEVEAFARALAAELGVADAPAAGPIPDVAGAWVKPLANDLRAHPGRSLILAGDGQPVSLHALGHAINATLGNVGKTIRYTEPIDPQPGREPIDLPRLVGEMAAGTVELVLVLGVNPAYDAPGDVPFAQAIKRVPLSAHLGLYPDETAAVCEWDVPEAHYLEAWGDAVGFDGTVAIQQPLIDTLFGGRSANEFLSALLGTDQSGRDLVMAHWRSARGNPADFETTWEQWLRTGVVPDTAATPRDAKPKAGWSGPATAGEAGAEVLFLPDPTLHDGRFANNAWLQELPKPVTKLTWGNAAFLSPADARKLGIEAKTVDQGGQHGGITTDVVELRLAGRSIRVPAFPLPGHADGAATVYLGHGRERAGHVGTGVGANAFRLRAARTPWFSSGLEIVKTGQRETIACTQAHHRMEGRDPIHHTTAGEFRDYQPSPKLDEATEKAAVTALPPPGASHPPPAAERDGRLVPLSLYPQWPYPGRRWAMAIDLSTCTGCSACVVACQSENNIPTVGKDQVLRAREMHWLRVDLFGTGPDPDRPDNFLFQPVPCMQCEKAPCELVCPVGATVHSHDGLNDMVYNRCVGTRYCSNNCPYKVRRFNFLTYADYDAESERPRRNPEVTVRSRGVMEKCTYCVQRIRAAEIDSEQTGKPIPDGRVRTACQQACPSGAIVFGDWNDPASAVRKWKDEPHNYDLLAELNTRPRTSYLAAVRNPNPAMPGGA